MAATDSESMNTALHKWDGKRLITQRLPSVVSAYAMYAVLVIMVQSLHYTCQPQPCTGQKSSRHGNQDALDADSSLPLLAAPLKTPAGLGKVITVQRKSKSKKKENTNMALSFFGICLP